MTSATTHLLLVIIDLNAGTATFCRTLAAALKRYYPGEFRTSLLLLRNRGIEPADESLFHAIHTAGASVHNDWRRSYETLQDTFRLRREIRGIDPDVILTVGTYANLLVPVVADDRPVILTVHTPSTAQFKDARFGSVIRTLMKWRYPGRPVIAPTHHLAEDLRQNFGVAADVIPHGIDPGPILAMADEPVGDRPNAPYLIALGRLTAAKDYPTLLRAYSQARAAGLAEPLLMVGEGEDRQSLETLAADLALGDAVRFLGHRTNPFPYLKAARCLILSSQWEGFGMVLIEAMTLSVPCIATACPGGPAEILGDSQYGLLVPPADPAALASAMLQLTRSAALRTELAQKSLDRAADYSLSRMADSYRNLLLQHRQPREAK